MQIRALSYQEFGWTLQMNATMTGYESYLAVCLKLFLGPASMGFHCLPVDVCFLPESEVSGKYLSKLVR
jgi:hypothetical protein